MSQISPAQIKAARAILDWTQGKLADVTGLSMATIRNLENGNISFRSLEIIRKALEEAGIKFTEDDGVRRRVIDAVPLRGSEGVEFLLEDIAHTIRTKGGCVMAIQKSQRSLLDSLDISSDSDALQLDRLSSLGKLKCLLTEDYDMSLKIPKAEFRICPKLGSGPGQYIAYGDRCVLVTPSQCASFKFILFKSLDFTQTYLDHFASLWNLAAPHGGNDRSEPNHIVQ